MISVLIYYSVCLVKKSLNINIWNGTMTLCKGFWCPYELIYTKSLREKLENMTVFLYGKQIKIVEEIFALPFIFPIALCVLCPFLQFPDMSV